MFDPEEYHQIIPTSQKYYESDLDDPFGHDDGWRFTDNPSPFHATQKG